MNALDQMHSRLAYVVVITNCLDKMDEEFRQAHEKFEYDHVKTLKELKESVCKLEEQFKI